MSGWIGTGAAVLAAALGGLFAWSLCRAAARMDEAFDDLDRELRDRQYRRARRESDL